MQYLVLIIPLNAQNLIISNAKMTHRFAFSVGGLGIGNALKMFSSMSLTKALTLINIIVQCFRGKADSKV
jgi:hypothetical protein